MDIQFFETQFFEIQLFEIQYHENNEIIQAKDPK